MDTDDDVFSGAQELEVPPLEDRYTKVKGSSDGSQTYDEI